MLPKSGAFFFHSIRFQENEVRSFKHTCIPAKAVIFSSANLRPMKLNLTVSGKLIDSIPVAAYLASDDSYLKALQRLLIIRHRKKLQMSNNKPAFVLERPVENYC